MPCEFSFAGCDVKIARRDLPVHMIEQQSIHLELLATNFQQQAKDCSKNVAKLKSIVEDQAEIVQQQEAKSSKRIADLELIVKDQQSKLLQKDTLLSENNSRIARLETTIRRQEEQICGLKLALEKQTSVLEPKAYPPVDLYMKNLEFHRQIEDQWFSEPFYSHPGGYKMCLSVYAAGVGKGNYSHVLSLPT